jgi:hypothetical protein
MDTSPFSASKTDNWVARTGGLNPYIRGVAHALLRTGRAKGLSQAIQMAVSAMKRWAAGIGANGKGHVHPQVQAAAAAALADWEAKRAASHSHANEGGEVIEMAGPHGYIHGWIKVGPGNASALKPGDMIRASHPVHGKVNGVVTHVTARGDVVAAISAGGHAIPGATFARSSITAYKPKTTMAEARRHLGMAGDGAAVELGGVFSEALHPRVAAGSTGGGQFTKGGSSGAKATAAPMKGAQPKGAKGKPPLAHPVADHPAPSGQQRARAQQLRAQAGKYRERAKDIRGEIKADVGQIHAAVKAQHAAKAAAAKSAAAAASGTTAAKKTTATATTGASTAKAASANKTTSSATTIAKRAASIRQMRGHVSLLRKQASALDAAAGKLDKQAAGL